VNRATSSLPLDYGEGNADLSTDRSNRLNAAYWHSAAFSPDLSCDKIRFNAISAGIDGTPSVVLPSGGLVMRTLLRSVLSKFAINTSQCMDLLLRLSRMP